MSPSKSPVELGLKPRSDVLEPRLLNTTSLPGLEVLSTPTGIRTPPEASSCFPGPLSPGRGAQAPASIFQSHNAASAVPALRACCPTVLWKSISLPAGPAGGHRSVGIHATRKSFPAAEWPGKVSGNSENHHLFSFYIAPPRRGGYEATFLMPCWAPGTERPFCLPPRGCSQSGPPSLPPPPGLTDWATAPQPSCLRASEPPPGSGS